MLRRVGLGLVVVLKLTLVVVSSAVVVVGGGLWSDDELFPIIMSFEEGYTHLFGDDNLVIHPDGKSLHLSLDQRTGSGFMSQDVYLHGFFSASIKLPPDYTAGVVVAFYMSNGDIYKKNHDEIDIEFLGNIRGKEWRIQTNIYGNGSTSVGREERYGLWFDPCQDFHNYSILWTHSHIIFYIDNVPIREVKRSASMNGDFPLKPMTVYGTIWDGSDWATNGGKYKVNYKYAPYIVHFSDLVLHGCSVDPTTTTEQLHQQSRRCDDVRPSGIMMRLRDRRNMESFRKKHLMYSYCYDRTRYKVAPAECVINPEEAHRLTMLDPLTFGNYYYDNGQHTTNYHRRHHHHTRPHNTSSI